MSFGLREDGGAAFHIEETHGPAKIKAHLERIEQMKHGHIVLAKTQVLKTTSKQFRLDKKIGQNDDQGPLPDRFG